MVPCIPSVLKLLSKMRANQMDWRIEHLKSIARYFGIEYRQPGTSHVTFRTKFGDKLTVPARKPIKPIYIKHYLKLIDELGEANEQRMQIPIDDKAVN